MRIAMWSGPRNLSTAMLYAFGNRADCVAVDEPFYAAYLAQSGVEHPMQDAILSSQPTDPARVVAALSTPAKPVQYLKVMAHHMLPSFPLDWARDCANVHLLRHPARVIASYAVKNDVAITLDDIGFAQAERIHAALPGPIIDSADIRANPEAMLRALCAAIDLPFDPAMLSWSKGPKPYDGAWAPHWYDAVHKSTGFAAAEGPLPTLPDHLQPLLQEALPIYTALHKNRLRA
ncbi:HAD family hydrolase [Gymnodinialimonas sp. 57CJ19]|uniref:sulfotransferase-like domain-containing protein n=1 Tax=Gymnodinialimonas sp. 57CJ19 TaxID=3138498 RepID=UPI0031345A10